MKTFGMNDPCKLLQNQKCALSGGACLTRKYCSYPDKEMLTNCDWCSGLMLKADAHIMGDGVVLCARCAESIWSCKGCKQSAQCRFESDPSPLPMYTVQRIQQGPMTVQKQVKNPEREKALCTTCECWHEGEGCMRQFGSCENHKRR